MLYTTGKSFLKKRYTVLNDGSRMDVVTESDPNLFVAENLHSTAYKCFYLFIK